MHPKFFGYNALRRAIHSSNDNCHNFLFLLFFHLLNTRFHRISKRMITEALEQGVIKEKERFSLHAMKRKGITDTAGSAAE